jgi:hypothetical protein
MEERTGGCLCGAARFTGAPAKPTFGACHCAQCLRWTGGPMMAVTMAPGLRWEGEVATFRSSDWAERGFCPRCGSTLFYRITLTEGPHAGETHVALGAFDDPSGLTLDLELFADRTAGAYAFAGEHKRLSAAETLKLFS